MSVCCYIASICCVPAFKTLSRIVGKEKHMSRSLSLQGTCSLIEMRCMYKRISSTKINAGCKCALRGGREAVAEQKHDDNGNR